MEQIPAAPSSAVRVYRAWPFYDRTEVTVIGIGRKVPRVRMPVLLQGTLRYLALDHFEGRWALLCFPARLTYEEARFLTRGAGLPSSAGEHLFVLAVSSDPMLLHEQWALDLSCESTALLIDPLKRLHREFGVPLQRPTRCQSFVIGPCGRLEFLMVHQLKGQGISTLAEILDAAMTCYQKRPTNTSAFSQKGVSYANRSSKR